MSLNDLARRDELRYRLLRSLYENDCVWPNRSARAQDIAAHFEVDWREFRPALDYLIGEHLVKPVALGGAIALTHHGVVEAERRLKYPDREGDYFIPAAVINVNNTFNNSVVGAVQSGGTGNVANVDQTVTNTAVHNAI